MGIDPQMDGFKQLLGDTAITVELALDQALPAVGRNMLAEPMRHAVLDGGKRLRAFLVMETARMYNVHQQQALQSAAAIECMHAYSLVHDDLPAMDNDELRRGKPTVHVKWDDATAILVGDALQSLAFELVAGPTASPHADVRAQMALSLAKAAGSRGMVLGQAQDIAAETSANALDLEQITELQMNKTGKLIEWAAISGAVLARQNTDSLREYASALGLAFQIQDDVLDVEGDAKAAGKKLQKDTDAGKATFVSLLGLDGAKARAEQLVEEACDALSPFSVAAESLRHVAHFVITRKM